MNKKEKEDVKEPPKSEQQTGFELFVKKVMKTPKPKKTKKK